MLNTRNEKLVLSRDLPSLKKYVSELSEVLKIPIWKINDHFRRDSLIKAIVL